EGSQRPPQRLDARGVSLRESRRQTVEEEIGRSRRTVAERDAPSRRGRLLRAAVIQTAGKDRGLKCLQIHLSRRPAVQGLELLGCFAEEPWRVASATQCVVDLGA